jgi:hypothetical protein
MTRYLTLLLPILLAPPVLAADPPKDLLGTFKATPFQKVDRLEGLPGSVRQAVHDLLKSSIANPGEKWNATDVILDPQRPPRRLIFAGTSQSLWFMYYEHGGRGRHDHILLIGKDDPGGYWTRWVRSSHLSERVITFAELQHLAGDGTLHSSEHGRD